jgi:hypothetical protein
VRERHSPAAPSIVERVVAFSLAMSERRVTDIETAPE